jgi:2-dehydro-3-deoxyphosphogluconate aldolase/(4S)-4-hydroxy-2-oxoglutarate aldolase
VTDAVDRSRQMIHPALSRIGDLGIIPVIRVDSDEAAVKVTEALVGAGLGIVEITMTVPNALQAMVSIASRFGQNVLLGAGTITTTAMAEAAIAAGSAFLVTPCLALDVVACARARGVTVIAGALTPTEIVAAHGAGADLVKVFPASAVGGPAYLRALKGPFPAIGLVPTGGVTLETVGAYIKAGAAAVGVGGELVSRDAVRAGDFRAIGSTGRQFLEAIARARAEAGDERSATAS